jgi:hypothetical protein
MLNRVFRIVAISAVATAAQADGILFQDNFSTPGTHLDYSRWDTVTGDASFLGQTQLTNWNSGASGQFVVGADGAELALDTYNPTGFSFYGTQAMTLQSFQPTAGTSIEFDTTLQLLSLQPGIVYGMYLYGCDPSSCATNHDEIDIELLTNTLQQGGPLMVELNRYANEPLGAGNGSLVDLPGGFDPLTAHTWSIVWSLTGVSYLVDGDLLASFATYVPLGPMEANEIAWAPASDWPQAYDPSFQPVSQSSQNQSFVALMTSVTVTQASVPEPASWLLAMGGLTVVLLKLLHQHSVR